MTYHHGITAHELTQGIMPMQNANMSTIGLIVTADDANSEMYPANTPVLLTGITKANIDNAGTQGTLKACLITMREIVNPTIIVLRITDTANVEVLEELLNCQTRLGISPKLLGAPEIDTPAMVKKMVTIAKRRRAFVYASPRREDGTLITDKSEIVAYRNQFGDRELMIIDGEFGIKEADNAIYIEGDEKPIILANIPSYYAYNEGLSPVEAYKSVEFSFEIERPTQTSVVNFRYKASDEADLEFLTTFNAHIWANLEPLAFRHFYFVNARRHSYQNNIFGNDIRFLDMTASNHRSYRKLTRPDQMSVKNEGFNQVVENLVNKNAPTFTPTSKKHHYLMALDEDNAKLLAQSMAGFFTDFATYVRETEFALTAEEEREYTNPANWIAVYDPAIIRTQDIPVTEGRVSGHDLLKINNQDNPNQPFAVQSDWVVRYIGN